MPVTRDRAHAIVKLNSMFDCGVYFGNCSKSGLAYTGQTVPVPTPL